MCVPVKQDRDPLHGNNDRLAVWGLGVRVSGAAGRAGFLLAWGETNMTLRDACSLRYGTAQVNLTSNPCHVWTRCKNRWEDERGGGTGWTSRGEVRMGVGRPIPQDSDQNLVAVK